MSREQEKIKVTFTCTREIAEQISKAIEHFVEINESVFEFQAHLYAQAEEFIPRDSKFTRDFLVAKDKIARSAKINKALN